MFELSKLYLVYLQHILTYILYLHALIHVQLIREISEENGNVVISFPRSGSNSNKVVLKGAGQCVEAVQARIQEIVEDLVSIVYIIMR